MSTIEVSSADVGGSVPVATDTSHLGTPASVNDGLRLDHPGTHFCSADDSVHVIRFQATDPTQVSTSYGDTLGGPGSPTAGWGDPYTGNGFTKAGNDVIPEYYAKPVEMKGGAELWEVTNTGTQRLVAVLRAQAWVRQGI